MKSRSLPGIAVALLLVSSISGADAPSGDKARPPLASKAFHLPELRPSIELVPVDAVLPRLPNRAEWDRFRAEQYGHIQAYIDPRSGAASSLVLSVPLIPGRGRGNHVALEDLGVTLGRPVPQIDADVVGRAFQAFLVRNKEVLRIQPGQFGEPLATAANEDVWSVIIPQKFEGIPVRDARIVATINNGNLILAGAVEWSEVHLNPHPTINAQQAEDLAFAYIGGKHPEDSVWWGPSLEIIPVAAKEEERPANLPTPLGGGYGHRLAWNIGLELQGETGQWGILVDAHTGDVLSFHKLDLDAERRKIKGSVYPFTNTDHACSPGQPLDRCGTSQNNTPMSYADYSQSLLTTDQAGVFYMDGLARTTLTGEYFHILDSCGAISSSSTSGDIDLGPGDPVCPSSGNTPAARTSMYHLGRIRDIAKGWLPSLGFLQDGNVPIDVVTNDTSLTCNAHFEPTRNPQVNHETIKLSTTEPVVCDPQCCSDHQILNQCLPNVPCDICSPECCTGGTCSNLGEIASVIEHEWGHALDSRDQPRDSTLPPDYWYSHPTEAYADIAAAYTLQTSCIGYGKAIQPPANLTACPAPVKTADQTGYNVNQSNILGMTHCAVDCSGFRELDYKQHNFSPLPAGCTDPRDCPDTPQNFSCQQCDIPRDGTDPGPCLKEAHCESAPATQAAWDLATRDLPTFNGLDPRAAFDTASRLFYQGSGSINNWYECNCNTGESKGCLPDSAYKQWLGTDDDNGDVLDGTPHMTAIFSAFDRHHIACAPDPGGVLADTGCATGPATAPTLTVVTGNFQAQLSWTSVPGATQYRVMRSEGGAPCGAERGIVSETSGTSYTDPSLADGRFYYYSVTPVGSAPECSGPSSACLCATSPPSTVPEICNGIDDNCNNVIDEGFPDTDGDGIKDCIDPDADADGFTKTGSGSPVTTVASSENLVSGTLTGTLADTQTSNDVYETIQEVKVGNISQLEMQWSFTVPSGHLSVIYIEAKQTSSHDNDNFIFAYSSDWGSNWTNMLTVKKTTDDNLPQYYALPLNFSGAIVVRVRDTNRSNGNKLDTLSVDRIHIVTSDPADCNDTSAAVSPRVNEGPTGAPVCSDAIDNNCDGRIDANDANCK